MNFRGYGPVSPKVSNGTLAGLATGTVIWTLVTFVPAFRHGLPGPLAALIPYVISGGAFFISGWLSKHKATAEEIQAAIADAERVIGLVHPERPPTPTPAPATPTPAPSPTPTTPVVAPVTSEPTAP